MALALSVSFCSPLRNKVQSLSLPVSSGYLAIFKTHTSESTSFVLNVQALVYYCFFVFRRIGEYISLDMFYFIHLIVKT